MTAPIASSASTPAATTDNTTALGKAALNKNDFLQMLVAQMKNQDPMNPMQGTEFATQLAQFSSVEQLIHMNDKLDAQAASAQQAANTTLGVSMVGHNVLVPGSTIDVNDNEMPQVSVGLPSAAGVLTVKVLDSLGKTVGSQQFTNVGSGLQTFNLDGVDLKAGQYSYTVTASADDTTPIASTPYATARVQGMSLSGTDVLVRVNGKLMPVSQILQVLAPAPARIKPDTTTTTNTTTTQGATTP